MFPHFVRNGYCVVAVPIVIATVSALVTAGIACATQIQTFSLFEYDVFNETIRELCAGNVKTIAWMHGQLWAVIKDSLGIYNQERDCWTFKKSLRIPSVTCMQQLADRLYIGTMKGLYLWYQEQLVCVLPDVEIFRLFASSKGELWIASRMDGLFRINSDGKLYREEISSSRVVSGQIREFVEDSQQNIWFGTFDGLQVYNPFEDSYKVYRPGIYPGQIEHESVFSLYCDNQGTIWVGTYYGGVNYFNLESDLFTYYHPHHIQDGKCLNFPIVGQIVEDDERNLWIATDGGGVNKFDRSKKTFSYYEATGGNSLLHDNDEMSKILIDYKADIHVKITVKTGYMDVKNVTFLMLTTNPEIAKKLKQDKMSLDYISEITGLSIDEIEKL